MNLLARLFGLPRQHQHAWRLVDMNYAGRWDPFTERYECPCGHYGLATEVSDIFDQGPITTLRYPGDEGRRLLERRSDVTSDVNWPDRQAPDALR